MKVKRFFICVMGFFFIFSNLGKTEDKKEPYKIGALFGLTGVGGSLGQPQKQALEMAVEELNSKGGVNGHTIELIIYDTEGDCPKALIRAKRLINNDNVLAIIGTSRTETSLAILDVVSESKIPMLSCESAYEIVNEPSRSEIRKWVFRSLQSDSIAIEKIYDYLGRKKMNKLAIISVSDSAGNSAKEELVRLAPKFNIEIIAEEKYNPNDRELTAQLKRIKDTNAQAVICWDNLNGSIMVAREMKQLAMSQQLVMSHLVASKKLIELGGSSVEGVILPAGKLTIAEKLSDKDPQKRIIIDYKKKFEAKFGQSSPAGGCAYDAFNIIADALEKAGADRAKVRDELERTKGFVGIGGIFNMSATDHDGLSKDSLIILRVKNGGWEIAN